MNTIYKIRRFASLFLSLSFSFLIAQGHRSINYKHILQNSITKEDKHFLEKYDYTVYFYEEADILGNVAWKHHYSSIKKTEHLHVSLKLILYTDGYRGNCENYDLLKSHPQTYILVSRIRLLSIKKNIISFEVSYNESSRKDVRPNLYVGSGVTKCIFEEHLVRTDTVTFEWFDKKKKWFAKNVK